jgi:MerR family redox-sensitive transcriptional activator SoxR
MPRSRDLLTVGQVSDRSGFAPSALRYYERMGLVAATRTGGGQRRYERNVLRRLAFIRAARNVGLSLDEVEQALSTLPRGRAPNRSDWARLSRGWRGRLDGQIRADIAASQGPGAAYLPSPLRRSLDQRHPMSAGDAGVPRARSSQR